MLMKVLGVMALCKRVLIVVWILSPCVFSDSSSNVTYTDDTRLTNELLERYRVHGTESLPRNDTSKKVTVWYGMRLVYMDIDEKSQSLTTSVWVRMRWYDDILTWNPDDYGGVKNVVLPMDKIWRPKSITVTNTYLTSTEETEVGLKVRYTGLIQWFPLRRYNSECLLDLKNYPYDVHTCTLWIQSLTWASTQLDLQPYEHNNNTPWDLDTFLESYKQSQQWEIVANSTERVAVPRDSVILMWSRRVALKFTLTLKRRPSFTSFMLRIPVIILSFMAVLIFCLPPERPDRNMLAMSLVASFMILLLVLVDTVPPTASSIPKLIYVYSANLASVIACIVSSVFVIYVSRRGEIGHTPHRVLQKMFFEVLARVLCIHKGRIENAGYVKDRTTPVDPFTQNDGFDKDIQSSGLKPVSKNETDNQPDITESSDNVNTFYADKQWKLIALILDRLFGITFLIINLIVVAVLFPRS